MTRAQYYLERPSAKSGKFVFLTNCVNCPGPNAGQAIRDMVDAAKDIAAETFFRRCRWQPIARELSYSVGSEGGLKLRNDWHVSYHKSVFRGQPCYYLRHSAIEYIFVAG